MWLSFVVSLALPASAWAGFGISAFSVTARDRTGTIDERAASHPYALVTHLAMNVDSAGQPEGVLHQMQVDFPPGLLGDPAAIPSCSPADFAISPVRCAGASQVGVVRGFVTGLGQIQVPIYNLAATDGSAAAFGVALREERVLQRLRLAGSGSSASIRSQMSLPSTPAIVDVEEEIWGVPADPSHDSERTCRGPEGEAIEGCSVGVEERALLTLPASCAEPLRTTITASPLDQSQGAATATDVSRDAAGNPRPLVGCEAVPFDPRLTVQADGGPIGPAALGVGIEVPQHEGAHVVPTAPLAAMRMKLPQGLALNPSAGSWLSGCSPEAIGLESGAGVAPPPFGEAPSRCPASSWLGTARLRTPLLDHELAGSIYLATPFANPFGARYAIYLVIEDEATGTVLKIPARVDADASDGRLTAEAPDLPQIPFSELELQFAGGTRAPLAGPPGCGGYLTEATFAPSTAPDEPAVGRSAAFTVVGGSDGSGCPPSEAMRSATPSFQAGTERAVAGGASALLFELSRRDVDQHLGSFDLKLPPGLLAEVGAVPVGAAVGTVQARAGVGAEPLVLHGTVYLGGPYKNAPYSLEAVVPAQVGPFDLGTVVQRSALFVDPATAQIRVQGDPLPQILAGVPLQLRALSIDLDRPGFIRNPTSCEPMAITGSTTTSIGQTAPLRARFQVGDCAALSFKPKLAIRLSGAIGRNGHPGVRAVLRSDPGGAAPASLEFSLPSGELLDLRHVGALCSPRQALDRCPPGSRLGMLSFESPALDGPLEGAVYLRTPGHGRLPGLAVDLSSDRFAFVLQGRMTSSGGRLGVRLPSIPDVPLSKAVLSLDGGRRGVVVNSRSLCSGLGPAMAAVGAHNGMRRELRVRPRLDGC